MTILPELLLNLLGELFNDELALLIFMGNLFGEAGELLCAIIRTYMLTDLLRKRRLSVDLCSSFTTEVAHSQESFLVLLQPIELAQSLFLLILFLQFKFTLPFLFNLLVLLVEFIQS